MFNVYKNQQRREYDGSKNATHNMVYLYDACDQISDFCHQQLLRKMRRKISWTDRGKTVYLPPLSGSGGIKIYTKCINTLFWVGSSQGRIQDFKLGGTHLKKLRRAFLGYFVWKITILRKKIIFFPILGGTRAGCTPPPPPPPPGPAPGSCYLLYVYVNKIYFNTYLLESTWC